LRSSRGFCNSNEDLSGLLDLLVEATDGCSKNSRQQHERRVTQLKKALPPARSDGYYCKRTGVQYSRLIYVTEPAVDLPTWCLARHDKLWVGGGAKDLACAVHTWTSREERYIHVSALSPSHYWSTIMASWAPKTLSCICCTILQHVLRR
jgi:hypothetical protein